MASYRKKPVVIEAVQLCFANWGEICDFLGDIISEDNPGRSSLSCSESCGESEFIEVTIPTLEGDQVARHGDFIIRGVQGDLYPCKPDIFRATYEELDA